MSKIKYEVTIEARVTKTYIVEADDENDAIQNAHEVFSILTDDAPEKYEEHFVGIRGAKS
jgi:hypothetical protein